MDWIKELEEFCWKYDINVHHMPYVINDPKVIPMIRGKAFEFVVKEQLDQILSTSAYEISNPGINAQSTIHDVDVEIIRKKDNKKYTVECKLAQKGSFRLKNNEASLRIKCMRSRTLGKKAAKQKAVNKGRSTEMFKIHNDQYIPGEFDLVLTSIANAFYDTDENGLYYWNPSKEATEFLEAMGIADQHVAFNTMYVALGNDLSCNKKNQIQCTRRDCKKTECNFIPNYPVVQFDIKNKKPLSPWYPIQKIESLMSQ